MHLTHPPRTRSDAYSPHLRISRLNAGRALIFTHMPRTGGTTLIWAVEPIFPRRAVLLFHFGDGLDKLTSLSEKRRSDLRFIAGHCPYGIHTYLTVPADYITLLRDPVKAFLSMYQHIQTLAAHPGRGMSIEAYLEFQVMQDMDNRLTRLIGGNFHSGPVTEALMQQAISNADHYAAIGLLERYDESIALFSTVLGWTNPAYIKRNANAARMPRNQVTREVQRKIEETYSFDLELYPILKARAEDQMQACGIDAYHPAIRRIHHPVNKVLFLMRRIGRKLDKSIRRSEDWQDTAPQNAEWKPITMAQAAK